MAKSLEELKPEIETALHYLESCDSVSEIQAFDAMHVLNKAALNCADPPALGIHMVSKGFGQLFVKIWNELSTFSTKDNWESQGFRNLTEMMGTYINMTDESPELCLELGERGCVRLLVEGLESVMVYLQQETELHWVDRMLGILHNCIRQSSQNRSIYRQANAVSVLENCLKTNNLLLQVDCLMILAYIVNETEREILATSETGLWLLLNLLKQGVESEDHRIKAGDSEFSVFELLDAINLLAINDVNKLEIEKKDVIPYIIRMLQDDFAEEDQQIAAEALWNLSFVDSIRQSDLLQGTIPTLEKLVASHNKDLRGASASALWQIKGGNSAIQSTPETALQESPPAYEEAITEPVTRGHAVSAQIMVSYQWDSQKRALEIRSRLVADGYKVWMDVINMKGDILAAMADAVQKSDVILLCMSEKYKDSRSCRSEATYAYKLEKKVIPLLLEPGYKPDGWLGLLQGMDLYYEFHSDSHLESSMSKLLKAVKDCTSPSEEIDGPITAIQQAIDHASQPSSAGQHTVSHSAKSNRPQAVSDWTVEDVHDWLIENRLDDLCAILHFCEGSHLQKLYDQLRKNEEKFKDEMKSDYEMNAPKCLQFTVALEKVFQTAHRNNHPNKSRKRGCVIS